MPADLIPVRCDQCRFFAVGELANRCHRYPPPNLWPSVNPSDWCGEWQASEAAQKALEDEHAGPPSDDQGEDEDGGGFAEAPAPGGR